MRILFKDDEGQLNCVIATHISFDEEDSTLWFYCDGQIWQTEYNEIYAKARIKEAYEKGKLDLTNDIFCLFKEEE